eukprot:Nitzschia sp. Nitz4//scaffold10_size219509//79751//82157//NITZ4_001421-RA/size219509-processed-gene-0.235-mRNA-1//1//CDS//3329532899//2535//frame0
MGKKWRKSRQILASLVALSIALQSWTFLEWTQASKQSYAASRVKAMHPVLDENVASTSPWFDVDILSIGSNHRLHYLQAQRDTFAQHVSVRSFFSATEDDDADPFCSQNLTKWQTMQISRFCHRRKKWNPKRQFLMSYWQSSYASEMWLKRKAHPSGWMCAQTRPMQALHNLLGKYQALHQSFPDYLILMDDDTYYNIPLLQRYLLANYPNSSKPIAIAGCMVRSPTNEINLTIPFGGYGLVLSKGYLDKLSRPIHCPDDAAMCHAIRKTNHLDERSLFQDGMSVSQLMNTYATAQPFQLWSNWTTGFCLHSDWLWGYVSNFYNVSDHVGDPTYETVPQARMNAYLGSEIDVGQPDKPRRICDFQRGNCHSQAQACHYSTPDEMAYVTGIVKRRYRNEFPSTSSMDSIESQLPPVIDILSLGSIQRPQQLQMQHKIMGRHPGVRHFFNVTEVDDISHKCHQDSPLTTEEATNIVRKCKSYLSKADKSSFLVSVQHQSYFDSVGSLKRRHLPAWFCNQRRILVGLLRLAERYRSDVQLPDYLLLLEDDTFYNMDIFADLLKSDETSRSYRLNPDVIWARSGCIQRSAMEENSEDLALPLTEFGVLLPKEVLKQWTRSMDCNGSTGGRCLLSPRNVGMLGPMQNSSTVNRSWPSLIEWLESQTRLEKYVDEGPLLCGTSSWLLMWMLGVLGPESSLGNTQHSEVTAARNHTYSMFHPFLDSLIDEDDVRGMCRYHGEKCHEDAFYCSGMSAVWMEAFSNASRASQIYIYRTTYSRLKG